MPYDLSALDRVQQRFVRRGTSLFVETFNVDTYAILDSFEFTNCPQTIPSEVNTIAKQRLAELASPVSGINVSQHLRLATFGDSRDNTGTVTHIAAGASGSLLNMNRVASQLTVVRPDIKLVFNGGVSGGLAANWDNDSDSPTGRFTALKAVKDVLAASPDIVYIQIGVNDILSWNGSGKAAFITALVQNIQAACSVFMGSGPFVVLESINPCAPAAATYINGYPSAGGWGANAADKQDVANQVNTLLMQWARSWPALIVGVDTSSAFQGSDGYAKTDGSYYDGTHGASLGAYDAAVLVAQAIHYKYPERQVSLLPGTGRSAISGFWTNPTNGLAEGLAITADTGTWAAETFTIEGAEQVINLNCTALNAGLARRQVDITPLIIGASAKVPVAAGEVYQASIQFSLSDGSGADPSIYGLSLRPRIFYDDGNEFTAVGQPDVTTSTDWPAMRAQSGGLLSIPLAIKAGKTSTQVQSTTRVQMLLYANRVGRTQLRLSNGAFRKIA